MPDSLDTGLIAFALPHEWRRSWLGTAAFSGKLPAALRQDQSIAMAMHHELVMKEEDEDLIDISQRVALTKAHIVTDITTLSAAQRYWLAQFPSLNETIPENAHPDLPKFNPPFNEKEMDQYQGKPPSRIPRCSPKLQDKINEAFSKLSDAKICDLHANPVGVASYVVLVPKPDGSLRICINFSKVNKMLNSLTRSTLGCSANQLVFGNRVNLDRFILPTAPQRHDAQTREAATQSATVDNFLDSLMIAQQDLLQKGDEIRVKILNDHTRSRPFKPDEELVVGQTVLVPWNDYNKKPTRFAGNFMGPYVVVRIERGHNTVALAHTIVPTPQREPATLVSAISELRLYDDSLAIVDYDVPEDRFRQLAYIGRNARPVQCIISYRRIPLPDILPATDVNNFEYQVRFEDSTHLDDTDWLPYSSVQHTFAFQSFYGCARRELTGHRCIAIPSALRQVHQSNASAASRRRNRIQHHSVAASDFVASLHLNSGSGSSVSDDD